MQYLFAIRETKLAPRPVSAILNSKPALLALRLVRHSPDVVYRDEVGSPVV